MMDIQAGDVSVEKSKIAQMLDLSQQEMVGVILVILLVLLIVYYIVSNIQLYCARIMVKKNPNYKNAKRIYKILCRFVVTITNHPKVWGKYREMFVVVNNSPKVPGELKKKLKERLMKKGLYINNMRIIDNYKGDYK